MFDRLAEALQRLRLSSNLAPREYTMARRADIELLTVLEKLDRRITQLEEDKRVGL